MIPRIFETRTLTVSIDRPPGEVYDFVFDLRNLPRWSFFETATRSGDRWIVGTPQGPVELRLVEANGLGVLDHYVKPESGVEIHVPMRVVPNGEGSEVMFTLFRMTHVSDNEFAEDIAQVERDLARLKAVMEER